MPETFSLFRAVRLANIVVFATALALAFDHSMASALSRFDLAPHWASAERHLVVADHTGDPAWQEATRHGVAAWNKAAADTGLQLTWTVGRGGCEPDGTRISICEARTAALGGAGSVAREGLARLELGPDRTQAHNGGGLILVCGDCELRPSRRRVVATHEIGHILGMVHSARAASVMYHAGGPDAPDAGDVENLRELYAHVDRRDRCGFFDLHVGALCF